MTPQRFSFPSDGEWDIVAGCESAGPVAGQVRAEGEDERLSVRAHPWLTPGMVTAIRRGPFEFGPEALEITPRLPPLSR